MDKIDPLYLALLYYRINKVEEASQQCTTILEKTPLDQAAWSLKLACFTEAVFIDELENDEAGLADAYMDDHAIATGARPGTSLQRPVLQERGGPSPAVRPRTQTGRPLSGMVRPDSRLRTGSMEQALRTSRTARTARPISSQTSRQVRLGTASIVAQHDQFVNLSRLNVEKYAADATVNRFLFEYAFLHENDMKTAHEIASVATKAAEFEDWYWKNQLGKCYYRLGMLREAERQFTSSLRNCKLVETFAYLAKIYIRLDQPLSAIDHYKAGLDEFRHDITLTTGLARIYEQLGQMSNSIDYYKEVLVYDASNIEAIACVGNNFFYSDQPELAVKFYRRILQMGVTSAELYMNVGLCCFYAQQFDLSLGCVEQAYARAEDEIQADIWYNTAHVAFNNGDIVMAERCLRIALATSPDHAESLCNLGIIKMRSGHLEQARTYFSMAARKASYMFEAHFNLALLNYQVGRYYDSHVNAKKALEQYPHHEPTQILMTHLKRVFTAS